MLENNAQWIWPKKKETHTFTNSNTYSRSISNEYQMFELQCLSSILLMFPSYTNCPFNLVIYLLIDMPIVIIFIARCNPLWKWNKRFQIISNVFKRINWDKMTINRLQTISKRFSNDLQVFLSQIKRSTHVFQSIDFILTRDAF